MDFLFTVDSIDLLAQLDDMENLISELTRCMGIIEKNRDSSRFQYIDNVEYPLNNDFRKKWREGGSIWRISK